MEPIIALVWFLLVFGVPLALIVAAYIGLREGLDRTRTLGGFALAFLLHVGCVCLTFMPIFVMLFAGAHTDPVGQALSGRARILFISIEGLYALTFVSFCTYLAGRASPWPIPSSKT